MANRSRTRLDGDEAGARVREGFADTAFKAEVHARREFHDSRLRPERQLLVLL